MTAQKSAKPATAVTVNGLQEFDRLGRQINLKTKPLLRTAQAYRVRTIQAHRIVVPKGGGWRRSIPVFIRRSSPIRAAGSGGTNERP
jgi:hypothetical protein